MQKRLRRPRFLFGAAIVAGMLAGGCGNSDNFVFTNTVAPPVTPNPPVAVNDARSALGNATVTYSAANGVLTNDTVNGATITAFDSAGSAGGTVVVNPDGSFTYTPLFGFVGSETFSYTLSNAFGTSTATVTMTSTGEGWFVDNTAGTTGNGSQADPFDTLLEAVAAAGAGDTIFVARGDGSSTGLSDNITVPQGVDLVGEGQGLVLSQTIVPIGGFPSFTGTVTLLGDNTVSGIAFDGVNNAIDASSVPNIVISNNLFRDSTTSAVMMDLSDIQTSLVVSGNTFTQDNDTDAVDISFDGTCSFTATNNVFRAETGADGDDCFLISLDGTDNVTMVINDNSFFGNNGGLSLERGISLEMTDSSQATLTASGNECSLMDEPMVTLDLRSGANLTLASFSGNSFDQNVDGGQPEVDIDLQDATDATVVFDNNNITNSDERGIQVFTNSSGLLSLALRNNTITGTTGDAVEIQASPGGNICAEISNNVFGANLNFNDQTAGQFDVEQFGNAMGDILATLNTFNAGGITVSNGAPNSVADGACTIP